MAKGSESKADSKVIGKVFRCWFSSIGPETFSPNFDECLERHLEFFVDLWQADMYPSLDCLQKAVCFVTKDCEAPMARQIAKSVKTVLSTIHYKKHRLTSGLRTVPALAKFLKKVDSSSTILPLASGGSQVQKSSSSKTSQSPLTSQSAPKGPGLSKSIAALYGLSSHREVNVSQVTVSDDCEMEPVDAIEILDSQDCAPSSSHGYYFDHEKCCLVRIKDGKTEMSQMRQGSSGFCDAVFMDGDIQETEMPNLDLFVLKRPAAATGGLKRPASSLEVEDDEGVASEVSDGDLQSADGPPHEPVKAVLAPKPVKAIAANGATQMELSDGHKVKIGNYTGQSYIQFKAAGTEKWSLLVCCSSAKAARNGKHHHAIMNMMWDCIKSEDVLPSKGSCYDKLANFLSN